MFDIVIITAWIVGIILGVMWLFLPWIMIAKVDEVIEELRKINGQLTK